MKATFQLNNTIYNLVVYCYGVHKIQSNGNYVLKLYATKYDKKTKARTKPVFFTAFTSHDTIFKNIDISKLGNGTKVKIDGFLSFGEYRSVCGEIRSEIKISASKISLYEERTKSNGFEK